MIHHRVVDVVQPDLHYFGGFIRCLRVARMAAAAGMSCTVHMSGSGLGHLDVAHFASCGPDLVDDMGYGDIGPFGITCPHIDCRCGGWGWSPGRRPKSTSAPAPAIGSREPRRKPNSPNSS